ncbi:MAG: carbamoyltransferase HypF [Candidatus Eisenbacteria bacterium]|nr:carbamoyltransferase HypF [Candidatus Eisenbacteria bacterium]
MELDIYIHGTVQGVGFRPFVYRLANELRLNGFTRNTARGVEIHVEGDKSELFVERLKAEAPPNAKIDRIDVLPSATSGCKGFTIFPTSEGEATVFAPPDLFTCSDCLRELLDPSDRRYRYPFINCTNCGPRYTIIESLPYDRMKTTMDAFPMCPDCRNEYEDPLNRRFHAEPNACAKCGPRLSFFENGKTEGEIEEAIRVIRQGKVVAMKGLGGFHLVCDPHNAEAVRRLRTLKERERKPFALMARDIDTAREIAFLDEDEERTLLSPSRPIVLLRKKVEIDGISPNINSYGIMLPYTPLHALVTENSPLLVATSANVRNSPILKDEAEGIHELSDALLTHNRDIAMRCDDSVLEVVDGKSVFLRRARGFVPDPLGIGLDDQHPAILSLGGELKNTITILKDGYLVTSQYLGDMGEIRNKRYLEEVLEHYRNLYAFNPEFITCDLHPNFTTTRMAEKWGKPVVKVQHHIAHVYAVLAEHSVDPGEPFLGVAFDGVGFGEDGNIWGGEFFLGRNGRTERLLHLRYVPQQGGDLATREPWRMALSYIVDAFGEVEMVGLLNDVDMRILKGSRNAMEKKINSPLTSSMGRLFDAVSAMLSVSPLRIDYEAEAAMRLESTASEDVREHYPFDIRDAEVDMRRMIRAIAGDAENGESAPVISRRFHNTIAHVILAASELARERYKIERVILSGGVFLNSLLLRETVTLLRDAGIDVYVPERFSPGDEALSLGQAYYAAFKLKGAN